MIYGAHALYRRWHTKRRGFENHHWQRECLKEKAFFLIGNLELVPEERSARPPSFWKKSSRNSVARKRLSLRLVISCSEIRKDLSAFDVFCYFITKICVFFWLTTYYRHGHNLVLLKFTIKQVEIV